MHAPIPRLTTALADRYRIGRELGAGGMATVYLAHDIRHERDVAIKVLHPDLGAALGSERFLSEIRTTARLQHPHILPLLDSGAAEGLLYYVMPLVTGETLRARLERERQLPIADAVRIAREVASALDYAHRQGVIHRDIKPENILLHDGQALVADFGIALAVQSAGGERMTQTGLSLGTPQYMSPEQAMGEKVIDARSDVYALAAVTYEMLAGDPPFTGGSVQAIVAKILSEKPTSIHTLRDTVPEHIEDAVLTGLSKLPADRFATAAEFANALAMHTDGRVSTRVAAASTPGGLSRQASGLLLASLAGMTVAALAFAAWALWSRNRATTGPAQVVSFSMPILETGSTVLGYSSLGISRDGQQLAYMGHEGAQRRLLAVRRLDDPTERVLPGTEDATNPLFSPDGNWIVFLRGNQLFRVRISGGAPASLGIAVPGTFPGMTWTSDGRIIFPLGSGLVAIPEQGGPPAWIVGTNSAQAERFASNPFVYDEAGVVLYSSWNGNVLSSARIGIVSIEGGPETVLDLPGLGVIGMVDDVMVYVTPTGSVMGVKIDLAERRLAGIPVQLLQQVAFNQTTGIPRIALSRNGTLIYERGSQVSQVVLADANGVVRTLLAEPREYAFPRLSPDGRILAITVGGGGRRDIWLYELQSGSPTRLTTDGTTNERPEWSPDGKRVLYRTDRDGRASIWWRAADLSDQPSALLTAPQHLFFEAVISPDGRHVAYQLDTLGADIYYREIGGDTTPRIVAAAPSAVEIMPRISPDGRWIAFATDESGEEAVTVQPFPGPGGRTQVSTGAGTQPVWTRDGTRLIYRTGGWFIAARVQTSPAFAVTARDTLFRDDYVYASNPHANFDVSLDGRRLVVLRATERGERVVVTGWRQVVRQAMRAATGLP